MNPNSAASSQHNCPLIDAQKFQNLTKIPSQQDLLSGSAKSAGGGPPRGANNHGSCGQLQLVANTQTLAGGAPVHVVQQSPGSAVPVEGKGGNNVEHNSSTGLHLPNFQQPSQHELVRQNSGSFYNLNSNNPANQSTTTTRVPNTASGNRGRRIPHLSSSQSEQESSLHHQQGSPSINSTTAQMLLPCQHQGQQATTGQQQQQLQMNQNLNLVQQTVNAVLSQTTGGVMASLPLGSTPGAAGAINQMQSQSISASSSASCSTVGEVVSGDPQNPQHQNILANTGISLDALVHTVSERVAGTLSELFLKNERTSKEDLAEKFRDTRKGNSGTTAQGVVSSRSGRYKRSNRGVETRGQHRPRGSGDHDYTRQERGQHGVQNEAQQEHHQQQSYNYFALPEGLDAYGLVVQQQQQQQQQQNVYGSCNRGIQQHYGEPSTHQHHPNQYRNQQPEDPREEDEELILKRRKKEERRRRRGEDDEERRRRREERRLERMNTQQQYYEMQMPHTDSVPDGENDSFFNMNNLSATSSNKRRQEEERRVREEGRRKRMYEHRAAGGHGLDRTTSSATASTSRRGSDQKYGSSGAGRYVDPYGGYYDQERYNSSRTQHRNTDDREQLNYYNQVQQQQMRSGGDASGSRNPNAAENNSQQPTNDRSQIQELLDQSRNFGKRLQERAQQRSSAGAAYGGGTMNTGGLLGQSGLSSSSTGTTGTRAAGHHMTVHNSPSFVLQDPKSTFCLLALFA